MPHQKIDMGNPEVTRWVALVSTVALLVALLYAWGQV